MDYVCPDSHNLEMGRLTSNEVYLISNNNPLFNTRQFQIQCLNGVQPKNIMTC